VATVRSLTEAGAGEQLDVATFEPRVHPIPVKLDFMQPVVAVRRLLHQRGELRLDPGGRSRVRWQGEPLRPEPLGEIAVRKQFNRLHVQPFRRFE
jgi:hypothetical protein